MKRTRREQRTGICHMMDQASKAREGKLAQWEQGELGRRWCVGRSNAGHTGVKQLLLDSCAPVC